MPEAAPAERDATGTWLPDFCRSSTALAQETAARLTERTGLAPLSSPEFSAPQMVAMPIPDCDPVAIHDALIERYAIEIPVFKWKGQAIARVSVQGYNSREQMDLLIDALSARVKSTCDAAQHRRTKPKLAETRT